MNANDFDSFEHLRPFRTQDVTRLDTQWRRSATLGQALWGRTSADLQRQLLARYPEIPPNFDLADFQHLQQTAEKMLAAADDPRFTSMSSWARSLPAIVIGTQRFTEWEARCEIVRRAIDYLESH
jgi:hypothetical protein